MSKVTQSNGKRLALIALLVLSKRAAQPSALERSSPPAPCSSIAYPSPYSPSPRTFSQTTTTSHTTNPIRKKKNHRRTSTGHHITRGRDEDRTVPNTRHNPEDSNRIRYHESPKQAPSS